MFKSLGILAWGGCLLTLAYQGLTWVFTKSWPSLTLLDILHSFFGLDTLTIIRQFPVDIGVKILYVCFTTELSIFLWWLGVTMFAAFTALLIVKKAEQSQDNNKNILFLYKDVKYLGYGLYTVFSATRP